MKQVLAIRHVAFENLGSLAGVFVQRGYGIQYLEAGLDDLAIDPLAPDVVVILGGPIGAYDDQDYPFLRDEFRLLEKRLEGDRPTLGICLGAQIMARVLGAQVYPGEKGPEIGWAPLHLTPAGQTSALRHLASTEAVFHWHGDTFDLPEGAVHLASSDLYPHQAFAYQKGALALQFHPEVTGRGLESWFIGHACEIHQIPQLNVPDLRQATQRHAPALEERAQECWRDWLDHIEAT